MTHTLQFLHSLLQHHPSKDGRALAPAPIQGCCPIRTLYLVLMENVSRVLTTLL